MATPDERFMAAALRLSRGHLGLTATNPSVGCLIVKDDVIVGRAVTAISGRPHAETQALLEAGDKARGATAYVTLEPCSHHGRTPPCADALIAAGIARVVVSVTDPDERVSGQGLARLRDAGIAVQTIVLREEGERQLAAYLMRKRHHRPLVTLKLAVSADGMIGRHGAGQVRITGPVSRGQSHILRSETDAILVGVGTAIADDPDLTCRLPELTDRSPIRIVLDRRLDLPLTSTLVRTAREVSVIVVAALEGAASISPLVDEMSDWTEEGKPSANSVDVRSATVSATPPSVGRADISPTRGEINPGLVAGPLTLSHDVVSDGESISSLYSHAVSEPSLSDISVLAGETAAEDVTNAATTQFTARRAVLEAAGVEVLQCEAGDLETLLTTLASRGISSLLVEGGARVARSFLDAGFVDRILLFTGPDTLGKDGIAAPFDGVPQGFRLIRRSRYGDDSLAEYERDS